MRSQTVTWLPTQAAEIATHKNRLCPVIASSNRNLNFLPLSDLQNKMKGTSMVVQWLRLHTPNAEGPGSIPGQGTRSHMLQLRVLMPQQQQQQRSLTPQRRSCVLQLRPGAAK